MERKIKIVNVGLEPDVFDDLKMVAKAHDRTIKSMAKIAIESWIAKELVSLEKVGKVP